MKKIWLLALFAGGMAFSQVNVMAIRYGVSAGPSVSRVNNAHNPSDSRYTFQAGAFALIPVHRNDMFYVQPQIEYIGGGERGLKTTQYFNEYVSIPVYFRAFFTEVESEFYGIFGPKVAFIVKQKVVDPEVPEYSMEGDGKAQPFNFGLSGGIGYSYRRKWEMQVRYDLGLTDTYPDIYQSWDPETLKNKTQHNIVVGVNYVFD